MADFANQLCRVTLSMRRSMSAMSVGSAPITLGASTLSRIAFAPQTVSPLQFGITVASPTPSMPVSVPTRISKYFDSVCQPSAVTMYRAGLSGMRTGMTSMCVICMGAFCLRRSGFLD